MVRILQISDTHIVARGERAYGRVDTGAALARMVAAINQQVALLGPIDLVFVTGDLVDLGTAAEYAEFRRLTAPLTIPMVAVPGNHDDRETMRAAFEDQPWMPESGPINLRVDLDAVTVLGLDSAVTGAPHGALEPATLAWLQDQLDALAPKPLLVGLHHPPFETGIALMDRQRLLQSDGLARCLAAYPGPCRLVAGHVHRAVTTAFAGHPAMICPGTSHAVTLDLRGPVNSSYRFEPPGVLLHDFGDTSVSHLLPCDGIENSLPFGG